MGQVCLLVPPFQGTLKTGLRVQKVGAVPTLPGKIGLGPAGSRGVTKGRDTNDKPRAKAQGSEIIRSVQERSGKQFPVNAEAHHVSLFARTNDLPEING
jgi:hypothetical protein